MAVFLLHLFFLEDSSCFPQTPRQRTPICPPHSPRGDALGLACVQLCPSPAEAPSGECWTPPQQAVAQTTFAGPCPPPTPLFPRLVLKIPDSLCYFSHPQNLTLTQPIHSSLAPFLVQSSRPVQASSGRLRSPTPRVFRPFPQSLHVMLSK